MRNVFIPTHLPLVPDRALRKALEELTYAQRVLARDTSETAEQLREEIAEAVTALEAELEERHGAGIQ